jgi:stalled ribosome rescue protein Dom34
VDISILEKLVDPDVNKESQMKKNIGLWIDHREAVLVIITEGTEEILHITSSDQKYIRYSGRSHSGTPKGSKEITAEDQMDRKFGNQLNKYYDEVIAAVRSADAIQIFGPGEAKGELKKRIERDGLKAHIPVVETTDKMTERQIAAKVREHFLTESAAVK